MGGEGSGHRCVPPPAVRAEVLRHVHRGGAGLGRDTSHDVDGVALADHQAPAELLVEVVEATGEEPEPVLARRAEQCGVGDEEPDDRRAVRRRGLEHRVVAEAEVAAEPGHRGSRGHDGCTSRSRRRSTRRIRARLNRCTAMHGALATTA